MRGKTQPEFQAPADGVAAGIAFNDAPVVIADPADNAGGGAPSDNTTLLRELIAADAQDAAPGPIWDPLAVTLCFDARQGAPIPPPFSGQIGPAPGPPRAPRGRVTAVRRGA